jgi:hypothetical protein
MPVPKPGFDPRGVHVGFIKYNMTLREVFLRIVPFSLISVIPTTSVLFSFADNIEAVKTFQPLA